MAEAAEEQERNAEEQLRRRAEELAVPPESGRSGGWTHASNGEPRCAQFTAERDAQVVG